MGEKNNTVSDSFCVFMPSEFNYLWKHEGSTNEERPYAWTMPENEVLYKEKLRIIVDGLKYEKKVYVVLPEISYNHSKNGPYARWFLYDFQLKTANEIKSLIITTPGEHAFEVTRALARPLLKEILTELVNSNEGKFINFIRIPRPNTNNKKNKSMLLFVESLSSSWFTELKPPNVRVQHWLKECQQFLIQCGFTYNAIYDDICLCGLAPPKCPLKNKVVIKNTDKEK
jgi:hypothetical protein